MIDETHDDEDFGALFEESQKKQRRRFTVGERVTATVVQVGAERLLLDLGDGQDAMMELNRWEAGSLPELEEGATLEAYVLGFSDRVAELGLEPGRGSTSRLGLEQARDTGSPVQGVVMEVNKGGYVVDVGGTRAFCPMGAMDVRRVEDPSTMIGKKLLFRITEMKGPRDVVLNRRVVLEEENSRRAAETRAGLEVGARRRGEVRAVRDFGAFVDIGGVEGLVPASEIGHARVRPADAVVLGQVVDVEVMGIGPGPDGRERITLSMKALQDDPFAPVAAQLRPGTIAAGKVTRIQPFGAFVELAPGVEGLIHVSAFGRRIGHPSEAVATGQEVAVRIDSADAQARRIGLHLADPAELAGGVSSDGVGGVRILRAASDVVESPREPAKDEARPAATSAPGERPRIGDVVEVTVDKAEAFGVFVSWPAGRGLVPGRELGAPRGADLKRQYPQGTTFQAAIIDVRTDGKVTLSRTAVERMQERADTEAYVQQAGSPKGKGLGTLGEILESRRRR